MLWIQGPVLQAKGKPGAKALEVEFVWHAQKI